jgi:hypothetical protein
MLTTISQASGIRRLKAFAQPVLRRKRFVVWMGILGALAGMVLAETKQPVYYSRVRIHTEPRYEGCMIGFDPSSPPRCLRLDIARQIDSAMTLFGLPNPNVEQSVLDKLKKESQ